MKRNKIKVIFVVGARPNFMKISPILESFKSKANTFESIIVHTGQHYDKKLSENILFDLKFPKPNYFLNVGSGSHAKQTSEVMVKFEEVCMEIRPTIIVIAGDVNSTLACAIVASKLHIKIAHIESGLRSFDRKMPEEINRIITDSISDLLFTTEASGMNNLLREGVDRSKIHFVGNTMIDSLLKYVSKAKKLKPWIAYGFSGKDYILLTLHRPSNVDKENSLQMMIREVSKISTILPVLFVIHPRTKNNIKKYNFKLPSSVIFTDSLPYIEFLGLMSKAKIILTDSGGIQEETTALNIPCVTLRDNTERPVTVEVGTNVLLGKISQSTYSDFKKVMTKFKKTKSTPKLWDGKSSDRICQIIEQYFKLER